MRRKKKGVHKSHPKHEEHNLICSCMNLQHLVQSNMYQKPEGNKTPYDMTDSQKHQYLQRHNIA